MRQSHLLNIKVTDSIRRKGFEDGLIKENEQLFVKFNSEFLVTRTIMEMERIIQILLFQIACTLSFSLKKKKKQNPRLLRAYYVQSSMPGVLVE